MYYHRNVFLAKKQAFCSVRASIMQVAWRYVGNADDCITRLQKLDSLSPPLSCLSLSFLPSFHSPLPLSVSWESKGVFAFRILEYSRISKQILWCRRANTTTVQRILRHFCRATMAQSYTGIISTRSIQMLLKFNKTFTIFPRPFLSKNILIIYIFYNSLRIGIKKGNCEMCTRNFL